MKRACPVFPDEGWYPVGRNKNIEYNSCTYQPSGWADACLEILAQILPISLGARRLP